MLKNKAVVEVLGQVNTSGCDGSWLFNKEGLLLAYVGAGQKKVSPNVNAALIASIWQALERRSGDLKEWILVMEEGVIACTLVARSMLLAIKANKTAEIGMVRAKIHALAQFLDVPLSSINHEPSS